MSNGRLAIAALLACACDAQVTPDYRGERMVEIRGNIVGDRAIGASDAALLWWTADGEALATAASTEGAFPAAFTLSIYRRPPERALFELRGAGGLELELPTLAAEPLVCRVPAAPAAAGAELAIAYVAALAPTGTNVLGMATDFVLLFAPASLPATSFLLPAAGASRLEDGYHLMKLETVEAGAPGGLECHGSGTPLNLRLVESPGGLQETEIEIHIGAG